MTKRPKDLTYSAYKAVCATKGSAPMSEDMFKALPVEGEEGDHQEPDGDEGQGGPADGDGDEGGGAGEGTPAEAEDKEDDAVKAVRKSLGHLGGLLKAEEGISSGGNRADYLQNRLSNGTITKSERIELGRILKGEEEAAPTRVDGTPLRKSLTEYLGDNGDVLDAMPILKSMLAGVEDRLNSAQEQVATEGRATRDLIKSMAGVMQASTELTLKQAKIIKSLGERLEATNQRIEQVERQPAQPRAVRSQPAGNIPGRPLAKSTTGAPEPVQLTKPQILGGLRQLAKSAGEGGDTELAKSFAFESAKFETSGTLSPKAAAAVQALYR